MPYTTTATELQRHFKKVARRVKRLKQPLVVLANNKPFLLISDYQQSQKSPSPDPYGMFNLTPNQQKDLVNIDLEVKQMWQNAMGKLEKDLKP